MEYLAYILAACIVTVATRFLPYFLFKRQKSGAILKFIEQKSTLIIMIILMIYALASMKFDTIWLGVSAVACLLLCVALQIWRKNSLISIVIPTILYIYIVNFTDI